MPKKASLPTIVHTALAALLLALSTSVLAHEGRTDTSPEDGATVQGSPAKIGIAFNGEMRLTQFEVLGPNGSIDLEEQPGGELVEDYFVTPEEALSAGDYQVRWRGLSRDGHMMSDGFSFSVEH
ncbi:copper resistance protein CopC [Halomonas alkaliantarctica]|nr:copper resistance protein CopC [Halomonas alkaliantarctica]